MKRTTRLAPVQELFDETERGRARELGEAQRRLEAAQAKFSELRRYHEDYVATFERQAKAGLGAAQLRDFQTFLARLELALRQQEQAVVQARADLDAHSARWQVAARRAKALDTVVGRWRGEERLADDRNEQKLSDERAQRSAARHAGDVK